MSRSLWLAGGLAFVFTLLANLPAAWVLGSIAWPSGWQAEAPGGTLWKGRLKRLGPLGPLAWQVSPWRGHLQVEGAFQQQAWTLRASGWPWNWQARLSPGAAAVGAAGDYLIDGRWQGELRLAGQWGRCLHAEGQLQASQVAMLTPWNLALGDVRVTPSCAAGLQLLAHIQRAGEHRIEARLELASHRLRLDGQVQADAALLPPLAQAGWVKPGSTVLAAQLRLR